MTVYPVAGYPGLQTAKPQGTAAQLTAGDVDVRDVSPTLLAALEKIAQELGTKLTIFSGYRTSSYSVQVGGFANDPHTRGIAVDVDVGSTPIGDVPGAVKLIEQAGLVSGDQPGFFNGQPDPAHVQLSSSGGGSGGVTGAVTGAAGAVAGAAKSVAGALDPSSWISGAESWLTGVGKLVLAYVLLIGVAGGLFLTGLKGLGVPVPKPPVVVPV